MSRTALAALVSLCLCSCSAIMTMNKDRVFDSPYEATEVELAKAEFIEAACGESGLVEKEKCPAVEKVVRYTAVTFQKEVFAGKTKVGGRVDISGTGILVATTADGNAANLEDGGLWHEWIHIIFQRVYGDPDPSHADCTPKELKKGCVESGPWTNETDDFIHSLRTKWRERRKNERAADIPSDPVPGSADGNGDLLADGGSAQDADDAGVADGGEDEQ